MVKEDVALDDVAGRLPKPISCRIGLETMRISNDFVNVGLLVSAAKEPALLLCCFHVNASLNPRCRLRRLRRRRKFRFV